MSRAAAIAMIALVAACGHGRPTDGVAAAAPTDGVAAAAPTDGVAATAPTDGVAAAAPIDDAMGAFTAPLELDAGIPDAAPGPTFPAIFSAYKEHPACDPRRPDTANPNCCNGPSRCIRQNCSHDIAEVIETESKTIIVIAAGWDQLLIGGQLGRFVDEMGSQSQGPGLQIFRVRAQQAWAVTKLTAAEARAFKRVKLLGGCNQPR